jgi:hypothetical protein
MHGPAVIQGNPSYPLYFLKIANLSDTDIELSHIYLETETKQIFPKVKDRTLPVRLKPAEEWETWISAEVLNEHLINKEKICKTGRVRLTNNNKIYKSKKFIIGYDIPRYGSIRGGAIDVHSDENFKYIVYEINE